MSDEIKTVGPKYRAERVTVHHLKDVKLFFKVAGHYIQLPLMNISNSGVGAYVYQHSLNLNSGQIVDCKLQLRDIEVETQVEVRHITPAVCGAQFVETSEEFSSKLAQIFKAEVAGARLKLIEHNGDEKTYSDGFHLRLVCEHSGDELKSFRFSLWGNVIDYKAGSMRAGGYLDYSPNSPDEPQLISYDEGEIDPDLNQFAAQMVTQIEDLPLEVRQAISTQLEKVS